MSTITNSSKLQLEVKTLKAKLEKINKQLNMVNRTLAQQKTAFKKELAHQLQQTKQQAEHKAQETVKKLLASREKALTDAVSKFDKLHFGNIKMKVTAKKSTSSKKRIAAKKLKRNGKAAQPGSYQPLPNTLM